MKRRINRVLCLLLMLVPCTGCVWLQNEFFVYQKATPDTVTPPSDVPVPSPW